MPHQNYFEFFKNVAPILLPKLKQPQDVADLSKLNHCGVMHWKAGFTSYNMSYHTPQIGVWVGGNAVFWPFSALNNAAADAAALQKHQLVRHGFSELR